MPTKSKENSKFNFKIFDKKTLLKQPAVFGYQIVNHSNDKNKTKKSFLMNNLRLSQHSLSNYSSQKKAKNNENEKGKCDCGNLGRILNSVEDLEFLKTQTALRRKKSFCQNILPVSPFKTDLSYWVKSAVLSKSRENPQIHGIFRDYSKENIERFIRNQQLKIDRADLKASQYKIKILNEKKRRKVPNKLKDSRFPLASKYYNFDDLDSEHEKYLRKLEMLLSARTIYKDQENPQFTNTNYTLTYASYQDVYKGLESSLFECNPQFSFHVEEKAQKVDEDSYSPQISANHVKQGELGNCSFMAALSSIAYKCPKHIDNLFVFRDNPACYFVVKLFDCGEWRYFQTDNKFPIFVKKWKKPRKERSFTMNQKSLKKSTDVSEEKQNKFLFAKPSAGKIWVPILEKVYAKMVESYSYFDDGQRLEYPLTALSGIPSQILRLNSDSSEWFGKKQGSGLRNTVAVTNVSIFLNKMGSKKMKSIGLLDYHAYSFLDIVDLPKKKETLAKLRNPWGTNVWKGDWSFNSNKWNQTLRKQLNYEMDPKDGSCFMNSRDISYYFRTITLCKFDPLNQHTSLKMTYSEKQTNLIKVTVDQKGRYSLTMYFKSKKKKDLKSCETNLKQGNLFMYLVKVLDKKNHQKICSKQILGKIYYSLESQLQKGKYFLVFRYKCKETEKNEVCLTSYGPGLVTLKKQSQSEVGKNK